MNKFFLIFAVFMAGFVTATNVPYSIEQMIDYDPQLWKVFVSILVAAFCMAELIKK